MKSRKKQVRTADFARLWQELVRKLKEHLDPKEARQVDFSGRIGFSCQVLSEFLVEHYGLTLSGETIQKDYFGVFRSANSNNQESFEIGHPFLNTLMAVVHGDGVAYEEVYEQSIAWEGDKSQRLLGSLAKSYGFSNPQRQALIAYVNALGRDGMAQTSLLQWVRQRKGLSALVLSGFLIFLLILGTGIFEGGRGFLFMDRMALGLQLIWFLFATLFAFVQLRRSLLHESPAISRASRAQEKFLQKFLSIWLAWSGIYLTLLVLSFVPDTASDWKLLCFWLLHGSNNFTGLYLYLMHRDLSEDTMNVQKKPFFSFLYGFLLIAYTLAELLLLYNIPETLWLFSFLSGIWVAFATISFINRLDTKILDIKRWIINILIIYAAIQPLYVLIVDRQGEFEQIVSAQSYVEPQSIENTDAQITTQNFSSYSYQKVLPQILIALAFLAKIVLLVMVLWLTHSKRLLHYMVRIVTLEPEEEHLRNAAIGFLDKQGIG